MKQLKRNHSRPKKWGVKPGAFRAFVLAVANDSSDPLQHAARIWLARKREAAR